MSISRWNNLHGSSYRRAASIRADFSYLLLFVAFAIVSTIVLFTIIASTSTDYALRNGHTASGIFIGEAYAETEGSSNTIEITIDSSPRAISLYIDGVIYAHSQQPVKFSWEDGSKHVVELAEDILYDGYNKRSTFLHWNDFDTNSDRTITVSDSMKTTNFVAIYQTEYLLTILSEYSQVNGAGWYNLGELAHVSVSDEIVEIEPGSKRVLFKGWSGRGLLPNAPSNMIEMTGPIVLVVDWQEQYRLDLLSEFDLVTGSGWYDRGSVAKIAAQKDFEAEQNQLKVEFQQWTILNPRSGGYLLVNDKTLPQATVIMDQPISIDASWGKMYYVDIIEDSSATNQAAYLEDDQGAVISDVTDHGEGYYKSGQIASISIPPTIEIIPGKERLSFTAWRDIASEKDLPYGPSFKMKVEEPRTFQAIWKKQYYVDVESMYGTASGSGWYDEKSDVFIGLENVKENLGLGRSATFRGWISEESQVTLASESQFTIKNLGSSVKVHAQWGIDDSIRYLIIGGAVSAVIGFGFYIGFLRTRHKVDADDFRAARSAILNQHTKKENFSNGGRIEE